MHLSIYFTQEGRTGEIYLISGRIGVYNASENLFQVEGSLGHSKNVKITWSTWSDGYYLVMAYILVGETYLTYGQMGLKIYFYNASD